MSKQEGENVIELTNRYWRSLRLHDAESIEYVNRMFQHGWYIPELGIDGVGHFLMTVPAETPKRINHVNEFQVLQAENMPSFTVVVLHKGETTSRQMAIVDTVDESGYRVKGKDWPDIRQWKLIAHIDFPGGSGASLFERRG